MRKLAANLHKKWAPVLQFKSRFTVTIQRARTLVAFSQLS